MSADSDDLVTPDTVRLTCVVLGGGPLAAQCARMWTERGHRVVLFIASDPELRDWAAGQGLPTADHGPDLEARLRTEPFDYLFSIANLRMLPPSILALPRRLPVNFHDALLPRHAGLFATSWAVLESAIGPGEHGVTWHVMTEEADAGDVLVQRTVPLEDSDTAYSLNAKCFQAAIESFGELIDDLGSTEVRPRPQNRALRTYHGLCDAPPDGGILRWERGAAELHALIRAADFGRHPNGWGTAKLFGESEFVVVAGSLLPAEKSALPSGTIVALGDDGITVATSHGDLTLTRFRTLDEAELTARQLAERWRISVRSRLPEPGSALIEAVRSRCGDARPHEPFWTARLARLAPLDLPYRQPVSPVPDSWHEVETPVPAALRASGQGDGDGSGAAEVVLAAVLAFLARIGTDEPFDVALYADPQSADDGLVTPAIALRAPGLPTGSAEFSFTSFTAAVSKELANVMRRGPVLRDLRMRQPALHGSEGARSLPIAIRLGGRAGEPADEGHTALVHISADGTSCTWYVDRAAVGPLGAAALRADFTDFLAAVTDASADILRAPLMSPRRLHQVLEEWNDTASAQPVSACVTGLVERQALRRPDAVAVTDDHRGLTYRQLEHCANTLAEELGRRGVGPGSRVGILMRRSAALVVGLLGTLKSGAAYVPLDPVYPRRRLEHMIADAGLALVLTDPEPSADLGDDVPRFAEDLADPGVLGGGEGHGYGYGYRDRAALDDPAYVIYTSGSTGRPKGVQVGHRALSNLLCSMAETPGCGPRDSLLAVTTVCFDIAGLELYLPLITGGRVDLASQECVGDGFALRERIERLRPTLMQATPATWRMLLAAGWTGDPRLKVLCGGEALPADLVDELEPRVAELWNMYGPTETTIWSAAARLRAGQQVTIGGPISNTRFHVRDRRGEPVPPLVPGELYIGGDGVADGYFGMPELTAERFVPEPPHGARRMYRTGDLVRYLPGGELEYLQRVDDQAKVNGYRVELGEIEAVLARHPGVARAVAAVHEEASGERWIAAYLVAAEPGTPDLAELRRFAQAELPRYMVPASYTPIARIPLTDNGKVDRKVLPTPRRGVVGGPVGPAPGTAAETEVARAWRSALPHGAFGLDDNFFDVGGSSLSVVGVVDRLRTRVSGTVTVLDMFRFPTVRTMAAHLTAPHAAAPVRALPRDADRALIHERRRRLRG